MMKKLCFLLLAAVCLMLVACNKVNEPEVDEPHVNNVNETNDTISGTWKVKALNISGELTDVTPPSGGHLSYKDISITIPDTIQGGIKGNTFYNWFGVHFEINRK